MADDSRVTGYTLDFGDALPANIDGVPIDSAPLTRMDGYGLGDPLLVSLPNVDLTGLASEWNVAPSLSPDAEILWLEVDDEAGTLTQIPYWLDVDAATDPGARLTIVRPGVIMKEATRYIVALRRLVDTDGDPIPTSAAFAGLRAGEAPEGDPRQARFDDLLTRLEAHGVATSELQIAWDFVTASSDALHGPLLHMRDDAFAAVGERGPELLDVVATDFEDAGEGGWAFELRGRFRVPHYMRGVPSFSDPDQEVWVFNDPDGDWRPDANGWVEPEFIVRVPWSARDGAPHGVMLYGHGQHGRLSQVGSFASIANEGKLIYVACDLWGMSEQDVGPTIDTLQDLSGFPRIADRLHQGILNHLLLGRAMYRRLPLLAEMTDRGVVVDSDRVYYSGISQGGIYGPTIVAASPDFIRGHFSVSGPQYAYLLLRSRNFAPFLLAIESFYPERAAQIVALQVLQQTWNGTDSLSYFPRLSRPLPGGQERRVLITLAKGDVQVPPSANDMVARSDIGIPVMAHYDAERDTISGATPAAYPRAGSGIVMYDFGNPWPAPSVLAPPTSEADDPHGILRKQHHHTQQLLHFLDTGEIIDVCGGDACSPD